MPLKVNCMRCNTEIQSPNKNNAKYIMNSSDVRTHGPRTKDEFILKEPGKPDKKFKKFDKAKEEHEKVYNPKKENISNLRSELKIMGEELDAIQDTPENSGQRNGKIAQIMVKQSAIESANDDIRGTRVVCEEVTENVAKTAIICRDEACQDDNDIIIWG